MAERRTYSSTLGGTVDTLFPFLLFDWFGNNNASNLDNIRLVGNHEYHALRAPVVRSHGSTGSRERDPLLSSCIF